MENWQERWMLGCGRDRSCLCPPAEIRARRIAARCSALSPKVEERGEPRRPDFVTWQPAPDMPIHLLPVDPSFLAASPQGVVPVTARLGAEGGETVGVAG